MAAYATDSGFFTRRGIVDAAIIALHVIATWGFAAGLATKAIQALAPPFEAYMMEERDTEDEPRPPAPPEMERPPIEVPPPDGPIDLPMETTTTAPNYVKDRRSTPARSPSPCVAG